MHIEIEKHLPSIENLCRTFGVVRLELFGSAARTDFDPNTSDVDLLVEFQRPHPLGASRQYFGFVLALEDLLGLRVDLVELAGVTNPYFRESIEQNRKLLYDAPQQEVPR